LESICVEIVWLLTIWIHLKKVHDGVPVGKSEN